LYGDALLSLQSLQERGRPFQAELPPYDDGLLRFELSLFRDWLCGSHLGLDFTEQDEADWHASVDLLIGSALAQPKVFVHRDFHSRNLMVTETHSPGILDFQDAVEGPLTYDLVSLLKDCYIRWPAGQVQSWAMQFHTAIAGKDHRVPDAARFMQNFELMGVQRQLKAAGIFARLCLRDGKSGYLKDVPRTLEYVSEVAPRHRDLAFLGRLIGERCLPALRNSAEQRRP
jgi:aminoglycoside/choline kinase family phosphotransferase